ncbi:hypothetical protein [Streptomyces albidoflavus]
MLRSGGLGMCIRDRPGQGPVDELLSALAGDGLTRREDLELRLPE